MSCMVFIYSCISLIYFINLIFVLPNLIINKFCKFKRVLCFLFSFILGIILRLLCIGNLGDHFIICVMIINFICSKGDIRFNCYLSIGELLSCLICYWGCQFVSFSLFW